MKKVAKKTAKKTKKTVKKAAKDTKKDVKKSTKVLKKGAKKDIEKAKKTFKKAKKTIKAAAKKITNGVPKRKGPVPVAAPKLKKGQTWEDVPAGSDANMVMAPRKILVEKISRRYGVAYCIVSAPAQWKQKGTRKIKKVGKIGRKLEIRVDRFRPVRGGYNLLG